MLALRPTISATSKPNAYFMLATLFTPPPGANHQQITARSRSTTARSRSSALMDVVPV